MRSIAVLLLALYQFIDEQRPTLARHPEPKRESKADYDNERDGNNQHCTALNVLIEGSGSESLRISNRYRSSFKASAPKGTKRTW
jgi:hypothetical protein